MTELSKTKKNQKLHLFIPSVITSKEVDSTLENQTEEKISSGHTNRVYNLIFLGECQRKERV